jgi:DNA-directed RNA polymerase subunit RPC12/RpoP
MSDYNKDSNREDAPKVYQCVNCGHEFTDNDWVLENGELVYRCPDCLTAWYKEETESEDFDNFPLGYLGNMYYVEEEKRNEEESEEAKKALCEMNSEFIDINKSLFDDAENAICALINPMKNGPKQSMAAAIKEYVDSLVEK